MKSFYSWILNFFTSFSYFRLSPDFYYSYENKTNLNFPWKTSAGYDKGLTIEIDMTDKYQTYKCKNTLKIKIIISPNHIILCL